MNNRKLGGLLIVVSILLLVLVLMFNDLVNDQAESGCSCTEMEDGGFCPHQERSHWQTYAGIIIIAIVAALGIYLIFFEKSQKAIISTLEKQKQTLIGDEKFDILMKGLDPYEQKVIRAIKFQDGITQQTLRLRTDLHKSKLSIVLDSLEKKGLIKREPKGKTNQIFLKIEL